MVECPTLGDGLMAERQQAEAQLHTLQAELRTVRG